ncbi:hypothetical protein ASG60_04895 [Methylobacterium sp. Leaf469]|uniref:bestrophin-like domain n=1 Tax=Methylobacterium sp. Leaf469 TaxID=1736387 RepID=UPI0007016704|nr:DUF4239 domain-containing protein [Methylobacterium sp. Leaf469]KQT99043.1 hypothetical protein ASG60_04895 [Methylobacterium sp. Leaf469]
MILGLWLDFPVWLIFTSLGGVFAGATGLLVLLTNSRRTRPILLRLGTGMVPAYFTAISVLLALLTGTVANDAWERQRQAGRVVQNERSNLLAAHDLSLATVSDMSEIRAALVTYANALILDEWPKMTDGLSSPVAGAALGRLMAVSADPKHEAAGRAAHALLLDAVMNLRTARGERLALSDAQGDQSKWLTLMVLAGLTLVAIGLVHLERPVAQATTLVMFSIAMVTTLGVVALHERPFDGPMARSPAPIERAKAVMLEGRD